MPHSTIGTKLTILASTLILALGAGCGEPPEQPRPSNPGTTNGDTGDNDTNHGDTDNNNDEDVYTALLEPGGYIVGPEDFRIHGSEDALDEPVEVTLTRVELPADIPEIPEPLEPFSPYVTVQAEHFVDADNGWFAVSVPVSEDADPDDFVFLIWMAEELGHFTGGGPSYWGTVSGEIFEGRFYSTFYFLFDQPLLFVVAEGEWFN